MTSVTLPAVGAGVGQERPVHARVQPDDRLARAGGGGRAGRHVLLRRGPQGLRGHRGGQRGPRSGTRSPTATLSDVYAPTIDNTDVKSLDPIVTGPGFTALQPRDMTYTVSSLDGTGMACEVTAHDAAHHFNVVTDFITDPGTEAVVLRFSAGPAARRAVRAAAVPALQPAAERARRRWPANAGGESATTVVPTARGPVPLSYSTNSFTEAVNRSYAQPIYAALAASSPFARGRDRVRGTRQRRADRTRLARALTSAAPDADTGTRADGKRRADRRARAGERPVTVALGFGGTADTAAAHGADRVGRAVRRHLRGLPGRLAGLRRAAAAPAAVVRARRPADRGAGAGRTT